MKYLDKILRSPNTIIVLFYLVFFVSGVWGLQHTVRTGASAFSAAYAAILTAALSDLLHTYFARRRKPPVEDE